ncbi:MAG: hypothetical protein ABIR59_13460 [Gemmatimonadales bacterium]
MTAQQGTQQGARYSVGDTFTIVHRVVAPPASVVQPSTALDSMLVTLLGPPDVRREGDSVRIAYSVAVWAPGRNELVLPGAITVRADGRIDTLPDSRVILDVASVLPAGQADSTVAPKAARPWVTRTDQSWLPFLLLLPLVAGITLAAWWWRRRRGPVPAAPVVGMAPPIDVERLRQWHSAGEADLVLEHLVHALTDAPRAVDWHARLGTVRFAATHGSEREALIAEGLALLDPVAS